MQCIELIMEGHVVVKPEAEILQCRDKLIAYADHFETERGITLDGIWDRSVNVGKSHSGSWLGYQAYVYYLNFKPPPVGAYFDVQNGTSGDAFYAGNPNWAEQNPDAVYKAIVGDAGKKRLEYLQGIAEEGNKIFGSVRDDLISIITVYLSRHEDSYVSGFKELLTQIKILDTAEIIQQRAPKNPVMTGDMRAVRGGSRPPPHIRVQAEISAINQPAAHCRVLAEKVEKLAAHISRVGQQDQKAQRIGTNVFIGHGRSAVWRDLKDYIRDRLRLPYDEFNRVPVAGVTNIARLSEMLESAACAFVIMTAEDEAADGTVKARMNVIHEVGLFQGRLGFTRAIVLLEDGCEEFSNIQGLGQIRFPKGNISAVFDQIRQVLEREGLVEGPGDPQ